VSVIVLDQSARVSDTGLKPTVVKSGRCCNEILQLFCPGTVQEVAFVAWSLSSSQLAANLWSSISNVAVQVVAWAASGAAQNTVAATNLISDEFFMMISPNLYFFNKLLI
jgi:hypothetical protein